MQFTGYFNQTFENFQDQCNYRNMYWTAAFLEIFQLVYISQFRQKINKTESKI